MTNNNKFTKEDLKSGDVVLRRNGIVEIVCLETGTFIGKGGFNVLSNITNDLRFIAGKNNRNPWDIVAVRRPKYHHECQFCAFDKGLGELVYKRKDEYEKDECEEMTLDEVCKALGKRVKIVPQHSGYIIEHEGSEDGYYCECSECGSHSVSLEDSFCSSCGITFKV